MKNIIRKYASLAVIGAALAWPGGNAQAQITTNLFTFDTAEGFGEYWGGSWSGAWDSGNDHTANGGGSLYNYMDWSTGNGAVPQCDWTGQTSWPYYYPPPDYAQTPLYIDLSTATNLSFWVKWDAGNSTLGIDEFNSQSYATPAGWGDHGLGVYFKVTTSENFDYVANVPFPDAASSGWAQVNVPIPPGLVNINQSVGLFFQKYPNTPDGFPGVFAFWIDDIQAESPGVLPPEILNSPVTAGVQGLNIYDDGSPGDRQSIETVVTTGNGLNYGWVTNGAPVTYSLNIVQAPSTNYIGGQVHMMIMPGAGITELAPDWNEADAMVLFIERQTNNSCIGFLRYKLNNAGNNSYLFGGDTNVFGGSGSAVTNTIVAGYGGLLGAVTNADGYVGTWSITMTSATGITLNYPGGSSSFAFPQLSDAQAFTGPVTVYWGVQPNNPNWFQDTVLSNVSISGSLNTLNVDLTQALDPNLMAKCATTPSLVFATPADAVYWLQWAPPNPSFVLQGASSMTGTWSDVQGIPVTVTNFANTFGTSNYMAGTANYNPPPISIRYDNGDDSAPTENWVSGPTDDAGGDAGSGSVQLSWVSAGGSGGEAFVIDTFPSGQNLSGGTLSFDIMIDPSSTAGTNSDYGYFAVITRDNTYNWNPTTFGEPLLTAAGGATGQWAHISIPLGTGADSSVRALTLQISDDGDINGTQTVYIDNLQLTTPSATTPPVYNINGVSSAFITSPMLPSSGAGFFRLEKP